MKIIFRKLYYYQFYTISEEPERIKEKYKEETILAIVDGDHSLDGCKTDIINFMKMGCEIIIIDDIDWIPYIREVCFNIKNKKYQFTEYNIYNGIGVFVKKRKGKIPRKKPRLYTGRPFFIDLLSKIGEKYKLFLTSLTEIHYLIIFFF